MTAPRSPNGVNTTLTLRRRQRRTRYVESIDFLAMVRRIVRAAGQRVGDGDADELRALIAIREDLDAAIVEATRGMRESGYTWAEVGLIQGMSKQGAEQWFSRRARASANGGGCP